MEVVELSVLPVVEQQLPPHDHAHAHKHAVAASLGLEPLDGEREAGAAPRLLHAADQGEVGDGHVHVVHTHLIKQSINVFYIEM